ncbi:hypothetical protein [Marivirga arenosa]|uniref:Uncharacterized protein n=1 Tax=Marivirga arenosa TaxID=3059076 RepID=A0AA51ZXC2_9BACT|nr:hypothetical protein [Marivirga sp. BKB1-2]WNB18452.1 hypothetical protein QYS47_30240 [Marivirga sp. BKB1-2]
MNYRLLYLISILIFFSACQSPQEEYVCTPCNLECDQLSFAKAGDCPHCNMKLIKKSELESLQNLVLNQVKIENGKGAFLIDGGYHQGRQIIVHY